MKVLVYPHDLGIGGSQLNAIELAAAVRDLGHEVLVFGRPGALVRRVEQLGLEFVEAPAAGRRPSRATASAIAELVAARQIDVLHGYEWPPALDAVLASRRSRAVTVATVMSMSVPPFIPHSVRLVVGTEEIADAERRAGRRRVHVIEPPVDLAHNDAGTDPGAAAFRERLGIADGRLLVVSVARLAHELKLEGTLAAIETIGRLAHAVPASLVLVGDGPARAEVERAAGAANERFGAGTVVLAGQVDDPRPAYAAADVALGMGGSALRALAYGKPLVVQGEAGFWTTLTPETLDQFLWTGWYGIGDGPETGPAAFERELAPLFADAGMRSKLGDFGLEIVRDRFSLERAAELQVDVYRAALRDAGARSTAAELAALGRYAGYYTAKRARRLAGREQSDDFNARPVTLRNKATGAGTSAATGAATSAGPKPIFWFPGVGWDEVTGTDRLIVEAVSQERPVTWFDPPNRAGWRGWLRGPLAPPGGAGVRRLRVPATPAVTRGPVRAVSRTFQAITFARAARGTPQGTVVVANPLTRFPRARRFAKVLYVTDDWVAGSPLMGVSADAVRRILVRNLAEADRVAVVSPGLLERLPAGQGQPIAVIPNGAPDVPPVASAPERLPVAGVVGQLNERLDLSLLEAVAEAGVPLRLVGPRTDRGGDFSARLDRLLAHPLVDWRGPVPRDEVAAHLAEIGVGLTPYAASPFNRASSPLKTFEYLAAGLAVVASDLPVARWLATEHVRVAASPEAFAAAVVDCLRTRDDRVGVTARRELARSHGWARRGEELLQVIDGALRAAAGHQRESARP